MRWTIMDERPAVTPPDSERYMEQAAKSVRDGMACSDLVGTIAAALAEAEQKGREEGTRIKSTEIERISADIRAEGYRRGMEAAAKLCERDAENPKEALKTPSDNDEYLMGWKDACEISAERIRALAPPAEKERKP